MVPEIIIAIIWIVVAIQNALFYGWILLFGYLAFKAAYRDRRIFRSAVYGLIACLPLAWYCTEYAAAIIRQKRLNAEVVAAQQFPKLVKPPRTLIIHGGEVGEWQERLIEMGAFDEVIREWQGKLTRVVNARRNDCSNGTHGVVSSKNKYRARTGFLTCPAETTASSIPATALHLHLTPRVEVQRDWQRHFDLWLVEGGNRRLVGLNGVSYVRYPEFPPFVYEKGFRMRGQVEAPVSWWGEIPFLFERLSFDVDKLQPREQPSAAEVRDSFLRLRNSSDKRDQRAAAFVAESVGASVLTAEEVLPVMMSNAITDDFFREVGFAQFCPHIDRICDFQDQMIAVCKSKRGKLPPPRRGIPAQAYCDRLPAQCAFCRQAQLCYPFLNGSIAGCSEAAKKANQEALNRIRAGE